MRNLKENTYGSTEHFVKTNNLEKEAEKLFGKGWESECDIEQVEQLITIIGAKFYEVKDHESSDYDFDVVFNEDKKRISELEELLKDAGVKNTKTMRSERKVNGYIFTLDEDNNMYECRGDVCYDDEHDETPDPELWIATNKLTEELTNEGFNANADYSEKGWQEIHITQIN